ncbi:NACHT domain-containing protein [candidate division KSB1 bacterium]|nr:NACHT domain-containing protein [candidate division KSB1 bacterium]
MRQPSADEKHTNPENVLKRAFRKFRLLLLIGDPGSGKTTLMKYYAMSCLKDEVYKKFGFRERVLPLYFPLRELEPRDAIPDSLPENLARWAKTHVLNISAEEFHNWLHERPTLVLLDGLDEISDLEQRKRVCEWIDNTCAGLKKARFVVTSRWTGYRKAEGVELGCDHMRADVRDFSLEQQEEFLTKWFRAAFQRNYTDDGDPTKEWLARQAQRADEKVKTVIDFLKDEKNKSLRSLAAVPMLLQIMAILWQERDILPQSRTELDNASLNYLLDFRR